MTPHDAGEGLRDIPGKTKPWPPWFPAWILFIALSFGEQIEVIPLSDRTGDVVSRRHHPERAGMHCLLRLSCLSTLGPESAVFSYRRQHSSPFIFTPYGPSACTLISLFSLSCLFASFYVSSDVSVEMGFGSPGGSATPIKPTP